MRAAAELLLLESGGDNLAANFSMELADFTVYVVDVAGGEKIPRKGGPGITQSDVLVVNKTDLAEAVGADLDVMAHDASHMRGTGRPLTRQRTAAAALTPPAGPTVFAQVKHGVGVPEIAARILAARDAATRAA